MLVTTNNVSNQLRTRQHSSSYRHICLLPGISSALDEGDTTTYYDLLLLHIYRLADRGAGAEGGVGAASPPEQAWPALIRRQAPTLAITRPLLQQPAIADCFAPVGAADTGNVPRKNTAMRMFRIYD